MYITEREDLFHAAMQGMGFEVNSVNIIELNELTENRYNCFLNELRHDKRLQEIDDEIFTCKNEEDMAALEKEYNFIFVRSEDY